MLIDSRLNHTQQFCAIEKNVLSIFFAELKKMYLVKIAKKQFFQNFERIEC